MTKESDEFERVTRVILHNLRQHLGYEKIEGSKRYKGKSSGRKRQIDATVYRTDGKMIIVECKRHKRKVGIKSIGEFYYVINREVGAGGGLIVSSVGFDAGAQAVANAEKIGMVILNADATEQDYILEIADQLWRGISFIDIVPIADEFKFTSTANFVNNLTISDEWSFQCAPIERKEDQRWN